MREPLGVMLVSFLLGGAMKYSLLVNAHCLHAKLANPGIQSAARHIWHLCH